MPLPPALPPFPTYPKGDHVCQCAPSSLTRCACLPKGVPFDIENTMRFTMHQAFGQAMKAKLAPPSAPTSVDVIGEGGVALTPSETYAYGSSEGAGAMLDPAWPGNPMR